MRNTETCAEGNAWRERCAPSIDSHSWPRDGAERQLTRRRRRTGGIGHARMLRELQVGGLRGGSHAHAPEGHDLPAKPANSAKRHHM